MQTAGMKMNQVELTGTVHYMIDEKDFAGQIIRSALVLAKRTSAHGKKVGIHENARPEARTVQYPLRARRRIEKASSRGFTDVPLKQELLKSKESIRVLRSANSPNRNCTARRVAPRSAEGSG
jgi:hypothetical protein